jgi:hypothetical protein
MTPFTPTTFPAKKQEAYIYTDLAKLLRGKNYTADVSWPDILSGAATLTPMNISG